MGSQLGDADGSPDVNMGDTDNASNPPTVTAPQEAQSPPSPTGRVETLSADADVGADEMNVDPPGIPTPSTLAQPDPGSQTPHPASTSGNCEHVTDSLVDLTMESKLNLTKGLDEGNLKDGIIQGLSEARDTQTKDKDRKEKFRKQWEAKAYGGEAEVDDMAEERGCDGPRLDQE